MKVRWVSFIIIGLCVASAYFIGTNIQSELAPMEDRNQFRLQLTAVEGTSYDYHGSVRSADGTVYNG